VEVVVWNYEVIERPESQGGTWVLAKGMRPVRILENNNEA
jgi:hypothetical protein